MFEFLWTEICAALELSWGLSRVLLEYLAEIAVITETYVIGYLVYHF